MTLKDDKKPGDVIRSQEWNELVRLANELKATQQSLNELAARLQNEKLDTSGGTVSGTLNANVLSTPSLRSPGLGAEVVRPANDTWLHTTDNTTWKPAVSKSFRLAQPTTFLVIGHGAGKADDGNNPLDVAIRLNGSIQMFTGRPDGTLWGMGHSGPSTDSLRHVGQIVTLALCPLDRRPNNDHTLELCFRARGEGKVVTLYGPSLWLIRLGDYTQG
jgi:hypothetical protein